LLPERSRKVVLNESRNSVPEPSTPADATAPKLHATNRSRPKNEPVPPDNDGKPEQVQKPQIQRISYDRRTGEQ
jgi:hypothetical protein